jgi:tol-pal system protein YbgF
VSPDRGYNVEIARAGAARVAVCALWLGLSACSHASAEPAPDAAQVIATQFAGLEQRLAERDQLVTQLESRLSLLEAEQRQLRYALAEREAAPMRLHETARSGDDSESGAQHERETPRRKGKEKDQEVRPVLRLYENHRVSETGLELDPVPMVSERLPVAPLPESLGLGRMREPAQTPGTPDPYVSAIDLVRRRDFAAALAALTVFLREYPGDERIGRALFWRGEVLFAQKQYAEALSAFQTSLSREPRGEKAPDSLLKIGLCHKQLGAPDRARAAIDQLKTQFPQSNAARLARAEEA